MTEPSNADILTAVTALTDEIVEIKGGLHELNQRMGSIESRLGDVEETLGSLSVAFDSDSFRLVDHERRILTLEGAHL